ncbi:MAG: hypothetical protein IPH31_03555 [Lewinellaceae bacterium]|nr:hypothetical protein [Lewinellaceae bacterium]
MEPLKVNAKIESIRENIRKGKIKESLDELNQIITEVQDTGLENDFLYLSASFHSKEREINLNLTNNKEEWNKIIYAIIQLMYAVKEATLKGEILVATTSLKAVVRPIGYCIRTGKNTSIFQNLFHLQPMKLGYFLKMYTILKNFVILQASNQMEKPVLLLRY